MNRSSLWLLSLGLLAAACAWEAGVSQPPPVPPAPSTQDTPDRPSSDEPDQETVEIVDSSTSSAVTNVPPTTVPWASASLSSRSGPAPQPIRLVIGSLQIDAPVIPMGVDGEGAMDVPSNVTDVAWYRFGSSPGEPGSSVLAAHVDLASFGPGVFFDIDQLGSGEQLTIEYSDSTSLIFEVVGTERVAKENLDIESLFAESGDPTLHLVTCGGGFNPQLSSYDSNVIVTLVPTGTT